MSILSPPERLCRNAKKPSFPAEDVGIFDRASPANPYHTPYGVGRDPWFDRLTTLSEVEGESRKIAQNQIILDLPPKAAGDDKSGHRLRLQGRVELDWAFCHSFPYAIRMGHMRGLC
jgi:hypothetical protein